MSGKIRTFLDDRKAARKERKEKELSGYLLVLAYLGYFLIMIGIICLLPLIMILFYRNEAYSFYWYLIPGLVSLLAGVGLTFLFKGRKKGQLHKYQDAVLVLAVWLSASFICSVPFVFAEKDGTAFYQHNFLYSLFESVSGWSTTGLTTNLDVSNSPKALLFFRSLTQFFGGVGLCLIFTSAISDSMGMRLYTAEGHSDRLMPNLIKSARLILGIYFGYIVAGTIAYICCGMPAFEAVNYSICAVSTGGFAVNTESIAGVTGPHVNVLGVEIVTIVLMILGGTNFLLHAYFFSKRMPISFKHCETIVGAFIIPIYCLLTFIFINRYSEAGYTLAESIRYGVFLPISALTTCGLANTPGGDLSGIPSPALFIIIICMLLGYQSGSTSGGIKQYRIIVLLKGLWYRLTDSFGASYMIRTRYIYRTGSKEEMTEKDISDSATFIALYIVLFGIGSLIFTMTGMNIEAATFNFASSLSGVGLWIGDLGLSAAVNPSPVILITSMAGMLLGRLEILVVYYAIAKLCKDAFSRKRKAI